jgi:hypothetical protein
VADGHLVLAAAPDHRLAAPVTGRYRGTGVSSLMRYTVELRAAESQLELTSQVEKSPIRLAPMEEWLDGQLEPSSR